MTMLVGENSSGKTSFFALLYESISALGRFRVYDDNAPFDLGTFEDIVHRPSDGSVPGDCYSTAFVFSSSDNPPDHLEDEPLRELHATYTYKEERGVRYTDQIDTALDGCRISIMRDGNNVRFCYKDDESNINLLYSSKNNRAYRYIDSSYGVQFFVEQTIKFLRDTQVDNLLQLEVLESKTTNPGPAADRIAELLDYYEHHCSDVPWHVIPTSAIRAAPRRIYIPSASPTLEQEVDRIPYALNRLKQYEPEKWEALRTQLRHFGKQSGLFTDVDVRPLGGRSSANPFELIVSRGLVETNMIDVGYGVSQVLPFICDILIDTDPFPPNSIKMYYVQQPETHLHPAAQAALGSFFYDLSKRANTYVILETHSDFIIDRIRQEIQRDPDYNEKSSSMLFFQNDGGASQVHQLQFDSQGNVLNAPSGYRDFFIREELKNLGVDIGFDNR